MTIYNRLVIAALAANAIRVDSAGAIATVPRRAPRLRGRADLAEFWVLDDKDSTLLRVHRLGERRS